MEQSNSAIQKDIDSLRRELDYYTLVLERHKPFCCLEDATVASASTSDSLAAVTQALASPHTAEPSLPIPQIHQSTRLSSPTSDAAYDLCWSTSTFTTSAHTNSFNPLLASHSMFLGDSLPTQEGAMSTSTLPVTAADTSPPSRVALRDHQGTVSKGTFLMNPASSNDPISCSHSPTENKGAVGSPVNVHQQVHLKHLQTIENNPHTGLPSSHLSLSPQSLSEVSASNTSFGREFGQNIPSESESLLPLLTAPSISLPQTAFDQTSFSSEFDISADLLLSELLSTDEWILE